MRAFLKWLLIVLVAANLLVWGAWNFHDELVAADVLPGPPAARVDMGAQPLPPIAPVPRPQADELSTGFEDAGLAEEPGEYPPAPPRTPARVDSSAAKEPGARLLSCVVAGPFNDREVALDARNRLRSAGASAGIEEQALAAEPRYLVFVDPALSRDEARRTLRALKAQGIEDAAIILSGERANGVSVGMFHTRDFALARQQRVAALGYSVNVRSLNQDQVVYRLRVLGASPEALSGMPYAPCPDEDRSG